ncbi:hypothetical protein BIU82_01890 [Arthrobacter sp. SW1]|uniref:DUF6541 family protein n=1 Tax=Arthrobacter sp. SW1 TaxID=1920889 RepID=UPI000877E5FA|nr:DUF6541 family protein [Arthrobacter sp. SW1]OFI39822.1 hypothetical protein BIU82_01890 [Arthrobacter sp. SW1]
MSWWETLPTLGIAVLVFFVPGTALLWTAGVRGPSLAVLAVPVTTTVVASAGIVFGFARIPFNPLSVAALTLVLVGVVAALRFTLRRKGIPSRLQAKDPDHGLYPRTVANKVVLCLAVLLPAVIIGARYMAGFGTPESFSETFDNVYHLNAVRYIADTQSANTLTLGNLTETSKGLYPAGMHALLALVLMSGGQAITVAVNWGSILYAALVWPMASLFLVSRIVGSRPLTLLGAGALSAGFSSFPYLMVAFGILYPNHAALTMLPVALALMIDATGIRSGKLRLDGNAIILLVATVPGLALTHPSALVALLMFASPAVLGVYVRAVLRRRRGELERRPFVLWSAGAFAYFAGTLGIWIIARPPQSAANWAPFQTNAQALGEILGSAPMGTTVAWIIFLLTVTGLYVIARRMKTYWWSLSMFGIAAVLYLVVSAWPLGTFRYFMTGVWYSDSNRLAAMLPLVTLPVAALGVDWLIARLGPILARWADRTDDSVAAPRPLEPLRGLVARLQSPTAATAAAAVVLLCAGVATQGGTLAMVQERLATTFETRSDSRLVTTDELELMKQLTDIVPAGDMIVGNPRTGASMAYAFSGRNVVAPHILGARSESERLLMDHWAEAAYNPTVCPVISEKRAYWALDFADEEASPRGEPLEGTRDLADDSAPGVELVKAVGKARLFRVTACD